MGIRLGNNGAATAALENGDIMMMAIRLVKMREKGRGVEWSEWGAISLDREEEEEEE